MDLARVSKEVLAGLQLHTLPWYWSLSLPHLKDSSREARTGILLIGLTAVI